MLKGTLRQLSMDAQLFSFVRHELIHNLLARQNTISICLILSPLKILKKKLCYTELKHLV